MSSNHGPTLRRPTVPRGRRGIAFVSVLLLLTIMLYLATSFLVRGNFDAFSSTRNYLSSQAYYVANAGTVQAWEQFINWYQTSTTLSAALEQMRPSSGTTDSYEPTKVHDNAVTDATGNVIGYFDYQILTTSSSIDLPTTSPPSGNSSVQYTAADGGTFPAKGPYFYGHYDTLSSAWKAYPYDNGQSGTNRKTGIDTSGSFTYSYPSGTSVSFPFDTVAIQVTGSTRSYYNTPGVPSSGYTSGRVTRTVTQCFNVGLAPPDAANFSYVQDNWSWMSGFGNNQCQFLGLSGSNGIFSVFSGPIDAYGGGNNNPLHYKNGRTYYNSMYNTIKSDLTYITATNGVNQPFGQVQFPKNLWDIAPPNYNSGNSSTWGPFITQAKAQTGTSGTVTQQSVTIVAAGTSGALSLGTTGLWYLPSGSATSIISGGVADGTGSTKQNVVLGSLTTASGKTFNASNAATTLTTGDVIQLVTVNGMNIATGNIAIQGFVTGQGSLYAGRDLYISGDVLYANPPSTYPSQSGNPSGPSVPTGDPVAKTGDFGKDQLLMAAGDNVVQGDVTNTSSWWSNNVQPWLNYSVTDSTGKSIVINDGHEDYGLTNIPGNVNSSGQFFGGEADNQWTVSIRNGTTGQQQTVSLPLISSTQNPGYTVADLSGYPGYSIVPGTGEDKDGDGKYMNPLDYNRDFNFANVDNSKPGGYNSLSWSNGNWSNFPSGSSSYTSYQQPIVHVDGFLMANNAIAGLNGSSSTNMVFFGGEASKEDLQSTNLGGNKLQFYQDLRFAMQGDPSNPFTGNGFPLYPRYSATMWYQQ